LKWGIPLPFDAAYITYVWFDALVNYVSIPAAHGDPTVLSALGSLKAKLGTQHSGLELWPADAHVIGKDILKFHAVYWPIMLKAMGLPLPRQILAWRWQKTVLYQQEHRQHRRAGHPGMDSCLPLGCASWTSDPMATGLTPDLPPVITQNSPMASAIWSTVHSRC
jgi:hypothetical protein